MILRPAILALAICLALNGCEKASSPETAMPSKPAQSASSNTVNRAQIDQLITAHTQSFLQLQPTLATALSLEIGLNDSIAGNHLVELPDYSVKGFNAMRNTMHQATVSRDGLAHKDRMHLDINQVIDQYFAGDIHFPGGYIDTWGDLGRLQAELYRAVRLVVDTGLHYKKWPRQQAIDDFHATTGSDLSDVTAEIERYMAIPRQALGYKLGMLKFLELRELAKQQLGSQFDIKQFHDVILLPSARPMAMVEADVKSWIKQPMQLQQAG